MRTQNVLNILYKAFYRHVHVRAQENLQGKTQGVLWRARMRAHGGGGRTSMRGKK